MFILQTYLNIAIGEPFCFLSALHINPIRLTLHTHGRIEIYHQNQWGTICDYLWARAQNARVVCRQLGFTGGKAVSNALFGQGSGPIWLSHVRCSGNEKGLTLCAHKGWTRHECTHSQDAGVVCEMSGIMKNIFYFRSTFPQINHVYTII